MIAAKREDRLVRRAREIDQHHSTSPPTSRTGCCAPSSRSCSTTPASRPSWNVHRLANEQIIVLLGLENAIPELGAGRGADFSQAAAARRVPTRLEDVRRHLDIFPYSDQRSSLEVPLLRTAPTR